MRTTIYLPEDLHERVKGRDDVNVSATCQAALEAELRLLDAAAEATAGLSDTVERLARTRSDQARARYEAGYRAGLDWAQNHAAWDDLEYIARLERSTALWADIENADTLQTFLFRRAESLGYDPMPDDFRELRDKPFDRGLVKGAAEIFKAVKDLVPEPED